MQSKILFIIILFEILKLFTANKKLNIYNILETLVDGSKKELFKSYHFIYEKEKEYQIYSEEGISRYKIFKNNLKYINEENAKNLDYKLGLGPFTDMTKEEFEGKMLMDSKFLEEQKSQVEKTIVYSTEKTTFKYTPGKVKVNWSKNLSPTRNQGGCGSCWAFAATGAVEANYNIYQNVSVVLSTQQLVDCDLKSFGCKGGWAQKSFDYIRDLGIQLETNYPYKTRFGVCHYENNGMRLVNGTDACPDGACSLDKWVSLIKKGPIYSIVDAGGFGQHYKSGVLDPVSCPANNHAVLVYGIDSDEKGDFVMVRNSWGPGWGDQGSFKMRVSNTTGTCNLSKRGFLPLVHKAEVPPPNPPSPDPVYKCPVFYDDCNYKGRKFTSCYTNFDLKTNSNITSSIKIGDAEDVTLYSNKDCKGDSFKITEDAICLNAPALFNNFDNRTVSLTVHYDEPSRGCLWAYQHCCHVGVLKEYCDDMPNLGDFTSVISSFRFGIGTVGIIAYTKADYKGFSYQFNSDVGCLGDHPSKFFNDKIASIRFVR